MYRLAIILYYVELGVLFDNLRQSVFVTNIESQFKSIHSHPPSTHSAPE